MSKQQTISIFVLSYNNISFYYVVFYVPECGSDYEELKEIILANGGLVVD